MVCGGILKKESLTKYVKTYPPGETSLLISGKGGNGSPQVKICLIFDTTYTQAMLHIPDKVYTSYRFVRYMHLTSKNLGKIKTKPINLILSDSWQLLDEGFFNLVREHLRGKKIRLKAKTPKDHQSKAIRDAVTYFIDENNTRGKLIFPCGSGKSLTGYWITQKLNSKATIVAVPSLALVTLSINMDYIIYTIKTSINKITPVLLPLVVGLKLL